MLATLVFALLPIAKLVATDPVRALQGGSARAFGGKNLGRFRFALATSQIALSMLLLVLAALFTQSLANIARVDLGLRTESIVTFRVEPSLNGYTGERQAQTSTRSSASLRPSRASRTCLRPRWRCWRTARGAPASTSRGSSPRRSEAPGSTRTASARGSSRRSAFRSWQAAISRRPTRSTGRSSRSSTRAFAKRFGLGANPVGKRLGFESRRVSSTSRSSGSCAMRRTSAVKDEFPAQIMTAASADVAIRRIGTTFYVRTERPPETLLAAIPRVVARVDSNLPVMEARTFDSQVRRNVRTDWLLVTLSGTLAVVATLLAALGLYGVLSYMVAQRTREIGLRLALGAEPADVRHMVMKQVGWMAGIGVPIGIGRHCLIGNLAASLLFGLTPTDPRAVDRSGAVLLAAAVFGASYWPARRASRVDPGRRAACRVTGGRIEHLIEQGAGGWGIC